MIAGVPQGEGSEVSALRQGGSCSVRLQPPGGSIHRETEKEKQWTGSERERGREKRMLVTRTEELRPDQEKTGSLGQSVHSEAAKHSKQRQ